VAARRSTEDTSAIQGDIIHARYRRFGPRFHPAPRWRRRDHPVRDAAQGRGALFLPQGRHLGCTKEAIAFTGLAEFEAAGAVVVGVSKDSVAKHDKFIAKHELGVVLASDEASDVCERYGVWKEKSMYGKTYMGIERSTFLIDGSGKIAQAWPKVKVPGHADAVLEAVRAL
jgi:peroxiredoxin Q/BCP